MIEKNYAGLDGFVWWMGIVESRLDPLQLGRCQVRVFGFHNQSLSDIPTADLPWALPVNPVNGSEKFSTPKEGEMVFGFFADGRNAQVPIMMGAVPSFNTVPPNSGQGFNDVRSLQEIKVAPKRLVSRTYNTDGTGVILGEANTANNEVLESLRYPKQVDLGKQTVTGASRYDLEENSVIKARKNNLDRYVTSAEQTVWSEPYPAYNPVYPYNKATETESGHVFELDDTPNNERIHMAHRSGTFFEMYPNGSMVEKITKNKYSIIMADDHVHIMGRVQITVESDALIRVAGDAFIQAENDMSIKVSGGLDMSIREALNIRASSLNMDIGGVTSLTSGGNINMDGPEIHLNSGLSAAAGLEEAPARGTANKSANITEGVPIPADTKNYDADIGEAVKEEKFLETTPTGEKVEPTTQIPPGVCDFNPATKKFLPKSAWTLGPSGLEEIKSSEGYAKQIGGGKVRAYKDFVASPSGDPITIGYGTTGPAVNKTFTTDTVIDKPTAEQYLKFAVEKKFLPALRNSLQVDITQGMLDACLSLAYNIGAGGFARSSVVKYMNQKDWCKAADAFLLYNKAGGKVVKGLVARRQRERSLFLS